MNCKIVQDLLPLYHDGVCSEESRAAVEAHLAGCESCRRTLTDMNAPLPEAEGKRSEDGAAVVERVAREWRRLWRRALLTGAIAVAALADTSGIVLCEDAALDQDAKKRADMQGIPVFSCEENLYQTAIKVYEQI